MSGLVTYSTVWTGLANVCFSAGFSSLEAYHPTPGRMTFLSASTSDSSQLLFLFKLLLPLLYSSSINALYTILLSVMISIISPSTVFSTQSKLDLARTGSTLGSIQSASSRIVSFS